MSEVSAKTVLLAAGAVITGSHFVYTKGGHGSAYINKDVVYTNPQWLDLLCGMIADGVCDREILVDVVVAPAIGGVNIATGVARRLKLLTGMDVRAAYAEPTEEVIISPVGDIEATLTIGEGMHRSFSIPAGKKLVLKGSTVEFRRGYDKLLPSRNILVVEDIINTGGSVKEVVQAVNRLNGTVKAVAAFCNRGGISATYLEVPMLFSLMDVKMDVFPEADCPLCAEGVPINTELGKGKDFLSKKSRR